MNYLDNLAFIKPKTRQQAAAEALARELALQQAARAIAAKRKAL